MGAISYNRFRKNPAKVIEDVFDHGKPVTVTRADGKGVVIVSRAEFESGKETNHLLSSRKNARRLRASIKEIKAGRVETVDIP
ncbi:MAG TPA: type II toxin-antitoxin system prevent-host-death family antitoxin [Burkholderiales bacterium]